MGVVATVRVRVRVRVRVGKCRHRLPHAVCQPEALEERSCLGVGLKLGLRVRVWVRSRARA